MSNLSSQSWPLTRFGDVVRNVNDNVRDPLSSDLERYVGLDHLDPESLHIKRWGLIADGTTFTRKFVAGQVLFGKRRAYQRKVAVAEFDGICSGDILVFEPANDQLLPELLPFIVQSDGFFQHALGTSAGSLSPRTKWQDLARYEFALPPLDEQRRIAEILWAADEAIERINDCVTAQERLKSSLMEKLFKRDGVKTVSFGGVGTWLSGGTPSRSRKDYWTGDIPWASPKDMKVDVLTNTIESVSKDGAEAGSKIVPEGSIFIVVRGMILAHTFPVAIAGKPMAFNQDMKALIVSPDFNRDFIFYWLQSKAGDILAAVSDSSHGTKRITSDSLFALPIPCLPLDQQESVAATLKSCDDAGQRLLEEHKQLMTVKKNLLESLLT